MNSTPDIPPFDPLMPPQAVGAAETDELPLLIRLVGDARAIAETQAWEAQKHADMTRRQLVMHYHRDEHLQISAAEHKAAFQEAIIDAETVAREMADSAAALSRVERQLFHELRIRLARQVHHAL